MATASETVTVDFLIPDGTYTVVGGDGFHVTIDIDDAEWATKPRRDSKFPPRPAGTRSASLLVGPNNSSDFKLFAFIHPDGTVHAMRTAGDRPMRALRTLLSDDDPARFGFAYAQASGSCFRCRRKLTVPASLHRGLGPECASKVGGWFAARAAGDAALPRIPIREVANEPVPVAPQTAAITAPRDPSTAPVGPDDALAFDPATMTLTATLRWGAPGFDDKKARVKALGARWNGDAKVWVVRVEAHNVGEVLTALRPFAGFASVAPALLALAGKGEENLAASKAASSSFVPRGITEDMTLRPFQAAGVEYITRTGGRAIVADEMGLGKTPQSLAALAHLGCQKALIVVPATLKLNWQREARRWVKGARVLVVGGKAPSIPVLDWATIVVINYENIYPDKHPWLLHTPWDAVIADEAHAFKNPKAQRTQNLTAIIKACDPARLKLALMLTGTPVLNRPIEVFPLLSLIGREDAVGGFWPFVKRYCDAHQESVGRRTVWKMDGASNLVELNERMRRNGAYVRRVKDDVLTELPAKTWAGVPLEMDAAGDALYREAERDTIEWMYAQDSKLRQLAEEAGKEADKAGIDDDGERVAYIARYIESRKERSKAVAQLTKFEGLKVAAWKAKRSAALAWIDTFLADSDRKLIVFAHHIAVVDEVATRYNAPKIQGGMKTDEVEEGKRRFQEDPAVRVIVCNLQAGGVGHTLTAASDVAFLELPWTPALLDQAVDRAHRIGQRDAVTGWLLTASRGSDEATIDEILVDLLTGKRAIVNAATDGVEVADEGSVIDALAGRLLAGKTYMGAR